MSEQEATVKQLVEAWWEAGGYAGRGSAISVLEDGLATALTAARAQALREAAAVAKAKCNFTPFEDCVDAGEDPAQVECMGCLIAAELTDLAAASTDASPADTGA